MISKFRMRNVVKRAIQQLPTTVIIKRKQVDKYHQETGEYDEIATLMGVLYKNDTSNSLFFNMGTNNFTQQPSLIYFLCDWSEDSIKVKALDILETQDQDIQQTFEIQDPGSNMEIYLNMQLKEV
ncbi:hypothetical protein [Clostridium kluyveri]|uniref:hypothetical protein n=1 Tax=Clostridium kluyveri TaxID=1534 RepID=UPI0022454588|nr:hypothetical protein [Clostridium kluyveri]UZQ49109.1 hypothetical protein OP486_14220 [Clostridium kluyveri]